MEEEWMRDRALLRDLLKKTPQASPRELAQVTGRSISWVKKWRKRLTEGDPQDPSVLFSRSRAHHAPYFRWDNRAIQRIVEMRFAPPENLKRVPGPRALLYYLHRSSRPMLGVSHLNRVRHQQASACGRASATRVGCRALRLPCLPKLERISTCQTALEAVIAFLQKSGRPRPMTFDRDPRSRGRGVRPRFPLPAPSAQGTCLGVNPHMCPPHRPAKNAFAERFHRTYGQECLHVHQPSTLQEVTRPSQKRFAEHYNYERPHQGRACGNVPPRVALTRLADITRSSRTR